jgi:hypothetical protein
MHRVQKIAGGSCQPIEARHHQHIARLEDAQGLGQLGAICLGAARGL